MLLVLPSQPEWRWLREEEVDRQTQTYQKAEERDIQTDRQGQRHRQTDREREREGVGGWGGGKPEQSKTLKLSTLG